MGKYATLTNGLTVIATTTTTKCYFLFLHVVLFHSIYCFYFSFLFSSSFMLHRDFVLVFFFFIVSCVQIVITLKKVEITLQKRHIQTR